MLERMYVVSNEISNAMNAVASKECKQKDVASFYADIIVAQHVTRQRADVRELNQAIIGRWSVSGLERIKTAAWKQADEVVRKMVREDVS